MMGYRAFGSTAGLTHPEHQSFAGMYDGTKTDQELGAWLARFRGHHSGLAAMIPRPGHEDKLLDEQRI